MKEMIYSPDRKRELLHSGVYKGHKFFILNLGTHPTAYVECKLKDCKGYYDDERLDNIEVHGGFTYYGNNFWDNLNEEYLGWDYAHYSDYVGYNTRYPGPYSGKFWTTEEIMEEVKHVIDQLCELLVKEVTVIAACPFCGGEAVLEEHTECGGHGFYYNIAYIVCESCGAKGPSVEDLDNPGKTKMREDAITKWNARVQ